MMSPPVRLGIVGAGAIATAYVDALEDAPTVAVTAVVDTQYGAARRLAERTSCPTFSSSEALVAAGAVDAVLLATPPITHEELAVFYLDNHTHVLCEKPFATSASGAGRMLQASSSNGTLLTMASKFRYVADVVRARKIVQSGLLGEPVLFENSFTGYVDMSRRWNSDPSISGGGVLIDNGTHSVDIARFFLGRIDRVLAVSGLAVQDLPVEDNAQAFLQTESGALGSVDLSWSATRGHPSYVSIYGTDGAVRVGWGESTYRVGRSGQWVPFGSGYDKLAALRGQVENFAAAIRKLEPLDITAVDAIASVEVIDAAYRSMEEKRWVSVDSRMHDAEAIVGAERVALEEIA